MSAEPQNLHRAIEAAKTLRLNIAKMVRSEAGEPLSPDDERVLQDSFDGETTLELELTKALGAEDEDLILITGIQARVTELAGRQARLTKRVASRRGMIEQAMTVAEWKKQETPLGTISLADAADKIVIDDESAIPSQFWKRPDPVLVKTELGKALKALRDRVATANRLGDVTARVAELKSILTDPALPHHNDRDLAVAELNGINDPDAALAAIEKILARFPLIPGARIESGGKNLIVRRK
jgi:hypothetical protein